MARLELERGTDVLLLETGDALLLEGILDYPISLSPGLTVAVTIAAVWGRLITTVANLTVNSVVARFITYTRATTTNLTASVTVLKGWGRAIAITTNLTASVTISRVLTYARATSVAIGLVTTFEYFWKYIQLTLRRRIFGFTLRPRVVSLTLNQRSLSLTLRPRTLSLELLPRSLNLTIKAR